MLKDYLGNVRMVLTEEQKQDKYPVASMETAKLSIEDDYYTINSSYIVEANTVSGLPTYSNDNGIGNNPSDPAFEQSNSQKLYKLNSNTNKTGLGITLKVMAGDRIDILGKSYYFQNNTGGSGANSNVAVLELLSGLLGSPSGATANSHTTATELSNIATVSTPIAGSYLNDPGRDNPYYLQRPRAFVNYIFLDDQFRYTGTGGFSAVNNTAGLKDHMSELQNKVAPKNGYVYIYVSNESPVNVFFDNLQVVHTRSPILEETHYYPFGLAMSGISSKAFAFGGAENRYKFNDGTELNTAFDINLYETNFRSLDPQLGRFWQIDPMSESFEDLTLYGYANNNPILLNDPFGLASDTITLPAVTVIGKYKYLDTENGQVLPPIGFFHSLFAGQRKWNGILVDRKGYLQFLPDGTPHPGYIEFTMPDVGSRAGVRKATKFVVNKWLVYRAYKKVNGRLKLYIGKAKGSLKKRYSAKDAEDIGAEVVRHLDNLPDNATALGVEQAILDLNGGLAQTANKINAAVKQVYKDAGLKWLNENIPNWRELFKWQ